MTSSMNVGWSRHSRKVSALTDDRQQTAVRSWPRWSVPVCSMISLHRFDWRTFRPSSCWCLGMARFTVSEKIR